MPEELNLTLFQSFHWYNSLDGKFWVDRIKDVPELKGLGISHVWLPPAYKESQGAKGVGYAVYDLFDLGEFDQKGSVRTKYGTKDEYLTCIKAFQEQGIKVIVDVVMNHRCGADEKEKVMVRNVESGDRGKRPGEPYEKEIPTKYTFPGRRGQYSSYIWDFQSFTAVNDDCDNKENSTFYLIELAYSHGFDKVPSTQFGNFDYLLGADVNFRNKDVREELKWWGEWYCNTVHFDGVRLDAVKHMSSDFINEWVSYVQEKTGKKLLVIGEDWSQSVDELTKYQDMSFGKIQLFDVPLHYNLSRASKERDFDLRTLLNGSLVKSCPELAITFVDNHDTQPLQGLESPVDEWFQPLAYAVILLRKEGIPCVFAPSIYGASYSDKNKDEQNVEIELLSVPGIKEMLRVRKERAYGEQRDYFDLPHLVGWTREGVNDRLETGCAVLINNGDAGQKDMEVGRRHAGQTFRDVLNHVQGKVVINEEGWGTFKVKERSVSVWVKE